MRSNTKFAVVASHLGLGTGSPNRRGASLRRLRCAIHRRWDFRAVRRAGGARGPSAACSARCHRHARWLRRRPKDSPGQPAVEVRIGINSGEVVLRLVHTGGRTEYTPVGHAANLAARMQSVAPAGGIVISEDTWHLVEGYFDLHELGPTEVKGLEEPINVYEVIGAGPLHGHFDLAVRRGLTKFVGRESELKQMAHALELARGGGHGQIVAVVAEAGTANRVQRSTIARFCFSGARSPFVSADHDRTFFFCSTK
jgi:hypothetical protein